MTTHNPRQLVVDLNKCIGCWACANVCPANLIAFADEGRQRTLRFARLCSEDCRRCAQACPVEAIALTPATEASPGDAWLTATFDLLPCRQCGNPFTTGQIVDRLLAAIPREFHSPEPESWSGLCPRCRQATEAEKMAKEWIACRWPGEG